MRLYPQYSLKIYNIKEQLKSFYLTEQENSIMLTNNGFFQEIKNDIFIFKFNFKEKDQILNNYINNKNFILTPEKWLKIEERLQLPFLHKKITIKKLIFSPRKGSPVKFLCEIKENEVYDYYFTIPENEELDPLIKEDICSFLNKLN